MNTKKLALSGFVGAAGATVIGLFNPFGAYSINTTSALLATFTSFVAIAAVTWAMIDLYEERKGVSL